MVASLHLNLSGSLNIEGAENGSNVRKASRSIFMLCANKMTDFATAVAGLNLDFVIFQSYVLDVIQLWK